jgi:hypothetical protein
MLYVFDDQFDVLAHPVRRQVLCTLIDQPDDQIVIPDEIHDGTQAVETLRTELHHVHLPKLAEKNYVQWEQFANRVEQGPRFSDIRPLLLLIETHADDLPHDWPA